MWLDSIRAVPTIGLAWKPSYETGANILEQMRPTIYKLEDAGQLQDVSVDTQIGTVTIQRTDGLNVALSTTSLVCQFVYVNAIENQGEVTAPVVREVRPLQSYLMLMDEVRALLGEMLPLVQSRPGVRRKPYRIGVVADGTIKGDRLPPGFDAYLAHLARPWGQSSVEVDGNIVATLAESSTSREVCHHLLKRGKKQDDLMGFKLDWQRYYSLPQSPSVKALQAMVDESVDSALSYFGRFGLGDLAYDR